MVDTLDIRNKIINLHKFKGDEIDDTIIDNVINEIKIEISNIDYNLKCVNVKIYNVDWFFTFMNEETYNVVVIYICISKKYGNDVNTYEAIIPYHLSTINPNPKVDYNKLTLLQNSSDCISYVLFPYEQGYEIEIDDNKFLNYEEIHEKDPEYGKMKLDIYPKYSDERLKDINLQDKDFDIIYWFNNMKIYIYHGEDIDWLNFIFVVKDKTIISGIYYDGCESFQEGDGGTYYYIDGETNDFIIYNCGDVASTIIIKYNDKV